MRALPPEAWGPLFRAARVARRPLERFLRIEASSGILLLVATAIALGWASSRWAESYVALWQIPVGVRVGAFVFERSLEWVVNDVLMVIFFFVVGLEIRREIDHGELSELKRATLPVVAALGGMIVPACLYLLVARGESTSVGWGVPMATDIAFAVGVLTLLGKRVPPALRVLLLALAVIDDLGAILVIAMFYSRGIVWVALGAAAIGVAVIVLMQRIGMRAKAAYIVPAIGVWAGVYAAGVHPTIAGVLLGFLTPVRAWLGREGFVAEVQRDLQTLASEPNQLPATLNHVDAARREALSPVEQLIATLHPWVAFAIMPVFALANAGIALNAASLHDAPGRVAIGAALGLTLGKPLGVLLACLVALKLRISSLPRGLTLRHLVVLAIVAGIGFTMSLFIAQLAFTTEALLNGAKLGVLTASVAAGVLALVLGRLLLHGQIATGAAKSADEAERSTER